MKPSIFATSVGEETTSNVALGTAVFIPTCAEIKLDIKKILHTNFLKVILFIIIISLVGYPNITLF
ncbi:hypothetical protein GCM10010984_13910 [Chishuiella changwenlii]|uniref:Uncharacterized protein n=1 Tax=Chishuiella changwenlii TaxID=1434701 RepID=A0ABQ1TK75_9FLAO|nr:hypothetical protein GCM10010984_13910 [Chishuiella changwenlii]